ncbi:MAG: DNA mismatch repair protein MutS [Hyphomicrobiaceae bacterium]
MAKHRKSNKQSSVRSADVEAPAGVTPSMAQYLEIKAANPDSLLWYRMGDFYELFFNDAVVAAEALSIVLTKRGKHLGEDIPMCGVPVVRADEYLERLIRMGFRVAVCEQLEDPTEARKRGSKAIVRRDVVRLVTPGTLTEDTLLDARSRNYLTAVFVEPGVQDTCALASIDISTGEFEVGSVAGADLAGEIVRLSPGEVIAVDDMLSRNEFAQPLEMIDAAKTPVAAATFDSLAGERAMQAYLGVTDLGAFGKFTRGERAAIGALLKYVELTQVGRRPLLQPPKRSGRGATMVIDAASRASLELLRSSRGEKQGSLLSAIDRTLTGPGARELADRVSSPLRDLDAIAARLDAVDFLINVIQVRDELRAMMRGLPDAARAVSRLSLQRGGPKDISVVRSAMSIATRCSAILRDAGGAVGLPRELDRITAALVSPPSSLIDFLHEALVDDPPALRRDGGFVQSGYSENLDQALALRNDSRQVMANLESKYTELTGIKALKVKHNNILGYFVEVSASNAKPLTESPLSDIFRHRQAMVNAVRFVTDELLETEGRIASAAERALAIEQEIFVDLTKAIAEHEGDLVRMSRALADLDCIAALSQLAAEQNYVRPIVDNTTTFNVRGGRHPVVEQALRREHSGPFIENDCCLVLAEAPRRGSGSNSIRSDASGSGASRADVESIDVDRPDDVAVGRIWLVTGPNMAGKSTFLRQNALIALLAQIGSFVPARSAHIGIVDRLFSRVGASDDIASGRSTFMVEMVETAGILNQATEASFVVLDEIGRGTATFDGLAIAWATVEHLNSVNRCRTLFATHYHELTSLAGRLSDVANVTVDVKEWKDDIVFLHKVRAGAADRSYGIHVARLAGLPAAVTARANEVLATLEQDQSTAKAGSSLDDLPLFAASVAAEESPIDQLREAVSGVNPDELTPREALDFVYHLRQIAAGDDG